MYNQKQTLRGIALLIALLMGLSTTAFATETRASSRIATYGANLFVGQNGDLSVYFSITASYTMQKIGASSIVIQRFDNSRWVTECTLTIKDVPEIQASNAGYHSATISYTPDYIGRTYRAEVKLIASDSSGSSTASVMAN